MSRPLLSMFIEPDPSDDELLFARQLGVDCVYTWVKTQQRNYEYLARLRERVESYGLRLYNAGNIAVAKNDKIHLALPGRDQAIADFQTFVRDLGRAGIGVTHLHMGADAGVEFRAGRDTWRAGPRRGSG